ncbi:MAG: hypothetical protein HZB39_20000 [Planctomycetes bacterium]|nr:hypothetical protein [Planctomycetota bacterium]
MPSAAGQLVYAQVVKLETGAGGNLLAMTSATGCGSRSGRSGRKRRRASTVAAHGDSPADPG